MSTAMSIISSSAPILLLVGVLATAWFTRRTGKQANATADWSAFVKEQREVNENQKRENEELRSRLEVVETEVRKERDLRERIVAFTRTLLWTWKRQFPEDPPPIAPESIASYFD